MAPHSSTLAWKIPWMEEPGRLQSMGSLRVGHDWATSLSFSLSWIGEGNGNPLQCSSLENPRDGGAWWAAIYGVTQSWTRLKWLKSSYTQLVEELCSHAWHVGLLDGWPSQVGQSECLHGGLRFITFSVWWLAWDIIPREDSESCVVFPFFNFFFNWRIVALQCSVSFSCTQQGKEMVGQIEKVALT